MRRIAEEGHAGNTVPSVADGQPVDRTKDGVRVAGRDEGGQVRGPSRKFSRDAHQGSAPVAEVDGVEPPLRPVQGRVRVESPIRIAVRQDAHARCYGHERALANGVRAGL